MFPVPDSVRYRLTPSAAFLILMLAGAAARADLRFAQPVVNVGEVRSGAPLKHPFTFVNDGSEAVVITNAHVSCGCMKPHFDRTTLQPGEQGSLLLEVHTLSQAAGPHAWRIQLGYRAGNVSYEMTLQLLARVVREVLVEPPVLTVYTDQALAHEVVVTDLRPQPMQISAAATTSPHLKTQLLEPQHDAAGHLVRRVRLEVGSGFPDGRHDHALSIYTADPAYPELQVPVTIVKRSRQAVTLTPEEVNLVAVDGQPLPSRIILLRSPDGQPLRVEHVQADDPAITCRHAQGQDHMATIRVQVDRQRLPSGTWRSSVRVRLAKPAVETVVIPVICTLP
jgi:hypothetical protein